MLRYHGGKWVLAPWILEHLPAHRIYVEPFGGGGSVLLRKERSYAEVYNDLDAEVVNVFRVLRDPVLSGLLREAVRLTPFARDEFAASYEPADDPVERARRTVVRSFMGFSSASVHRGHRTGFRAHSHRAGTTPARDWVNWPEAIPAFTERLRGVTIESKDALAVIKQHDTFATAFYVDPPYVFSTRRFKRERPVCYEYEMTDEQHRTLAETLRRVDGMVVLSGYACELYDRELYPDWHRVERPVKSGRSKRTEVIWVNDACWAALEARKDETDASAAG